MSETTMTNYLANSDLLTAFCGGLPTLSPDEIDKIVNNHIDGRSNSFQFNAVDFEHGLQWFNTSRPLSLAKDLTGKIVVLNFFTYSCVNCLHVLPDLDELEQIYSVEDGVVVIGIHTPKFEHEKASSAVLNAVLKYNISHPVVNDPDCKFSQALQANYWPTTIILGPEGQILFTFAGAGHREHVLLGVKTSLDYFNFRNTISYHPLPLRKERDALQPSILLYPGKICTSPDGILLAISDTGHHRIIITCCLGIVGKIIGTGEEGFEDGDWDTATFSSPQGVCWTGDTLYVADAGNHAVRKIDLLKRTVRTVAGNGKMGNDDEGGSRGACQMLNTPWDICFANSASCAADDPDCLLIATAGFHQIWLLALRDGVRWYGQEERALKLSFCARIFGSGNEENLNSIHPFKAGFAQPSGLAFDPDNKLVYVSDSKSSAIRVISLLEGTVENLIGASNDPTDMFAFGDVDGMGEDVRLQFPLAVAYSRRFRKLLVADTFNHKIKVVDPAGRICHTLIGSGKNGGNTVGTSTELCEPGGLCVNETENHCLLYLADTNNHCIKAVDMNTSVSVKIPMLHHPEQCARDPLKGLVYTYPGRKPTSSTIVVNYGRVIIAVEQPLTFNLEISGMELHETNEPAEWSIWFCDDRVPPSLEMTDSLFLPVTSSVGLVASPQEQGFLRFKLKDTFPKEVLGWFMIIGVRIVFFDRKLNVCVPKYIRFMIPCRMATETTLRDVASTVDLRYLIGE